MRGYGTKDRCGDGGEDTGEVKIGDILLFLPYGGDSALELMEHASSRSRIRSYCGSSSFWVDSFEVRPFNRFDYHLDEGMRLGLHLI